jgi:hypothetical protein
MKVSLYTGVISERKESDSDPGQFHYALINDAQYHRPLS